MSMWTLIFIVAIDTDYFRQSPSVSVISVPYFQTEESCQNAGDKLRRDRSERIPHIKTDWSCVSSN